MRRLRLLAPVVAIAVIALAVLLVTASRHRDVREYSARVPNQSVVAVLHPSDRVCEGPVISPRTLTGISIWGGSTAGASTVRVTVQSAGSHRPLASGTIPHAAAAGEHPTTLTQPVAANTPVRICVTNTINTFALDGAAVVSGQMSMTGHGSDRAFSLSLLNDRHSLLASLPLAFHRASLFKLSWLGSWTFWVLAIALLAGFGVAVVAVAAAAGEDAEDDR